MLENEIENLSKQVDYLRSGEYLNQLRFERDMLQHVVDTNGVPSEVYDYLDCTHRNTELLEESQELKKQLEKKYEKVGTLTGELLYEGNTKLINQQKEFIEYLEAEKDRLARECSQIYENGFGRVRLVSEDVHDEISRILSKYKEIIGDKDE